MKITVLVVCLMTVALASGTTRGRNSRRPVRGRQLESSKKRNEPVQDNNLPNWESQTLSKAVVPANNTEGRQFYPGQGGGIDGLDNSLDPIHDIPRPLPPLEDYRPPKRPRPAGCVADRGQFASPRSCAHFLNCWDGTVAEHLCPHNLLFNDKARYCDYDYNVNCGNRPEFPRPGVMAQGSKRCPDPSGRYRSPTNCSEFFVCVGGSPFKFACPEGLVYNELINVCDFMEKVDCRGAATPKPPPQEDPIDFDLEPDYQDHPALPQPDLLPGVQVIPDQSSYPSQTGYPTLPSQGGYPGQSGSAPIPGQSGFPGSQGISGIPGIPAIPGIPGQSGFPGQQGTPGFPGSSGVPGQTGISSLPGYPGIPGQSGVSGSPGQSGTPSRPNRPHRPGKPSHHPGRPGHHKPNRPAVPSTTSTTQPNFPAPPSYQDPNPNPPYPQGGNDFPAPGPYSSLWASRNKPEQWQQRQAQLKDEFEEEFQAEKEDSSDSESEESRNDEEIDLTSQPVTTTIPMTNPWLGNFTIPDELTKEPCKDGFINQLDDACTSVVVCREKKPQLLKCQTGYAYDKSSDSCKPSASAKC